MTLKERLTKQVEINMTQERATEIVASIHSSRSGWDSDTRKWFKPGEREEVVKKWNTMPGHTCFADALYAIAMGR